MKKARATFAVLISLLMVVAVACSSSAPATTQAPAKEAPKATTQEAPKAPAQPAAKEAPKAPAQEAAKPAAQAPAKAPAQTIDLKVAHYQAPVGPLQTIILPHYFDKILGKSGVKINPQYYPSASLFPAAESLNAVKSGITDIVWFYSGNLPGQLLLTNALELPGQPWADSVERGGYTAWRLFKEGYIADEWKDVKVLGMYGISAPIIQTAKKPFRTLDDLKGMKLGMATDLMAQAMTALGGTSVSVAPADIYMALQKGTIDGTVVPVSFAINFKTIEVIKYQTNTPVSSSGGAFTIVMNQKKWDSLPAEVKAAMDEFGGAYMAKFASKVYLDDDAKVMEQEKKAGKEMIDLAPDVLAQANKLLSPISEKWVNDMAAKGLPGKKVLDAAVQISKEYKP